MVNKKEELADWCHNLIHSLRLINGYKPSEAEKRLSQEVIKVYKDECKECKEREEQIKNIPKQKSFFEKLSGAMN